MTSIASTPAHAAPPRGAVRRLLGLAADEWPLLLAGTFFLILGSGMGLAFPQAIRVILDQVLAQSGTELIDLAALAMLAIFIVQGVAMAMRSYLFTLAGERIVAQLRERLFASILSQEIAFFDAQRTGELLNRLASDTAVLQNTASVNISMALRHAATGLGGIGLLFYTSPRLTLVMLLVVTPVAIGAVLNGSRLRRLSSQVQDALARASEVAEEAVAGVRTVRAFAQEPHEVARYGAAVQDSFALAKHRSRVTAIFLGAASFAGYGAIAVVLWYGGHLVVDGAISVGELTSFILYTLLVAFSLGALGGLWSDVMRAAGASERVFELMDRAPEIPAAGGLRPQSTRGAIALHNVTFAYPTRPEVPVLRGVDIELAAGEVVALVGASGGGKSTIAALIGRLYDPQEGQITLDGAPLRDLDPAWLRHQIGAVAQEPILFSTSVADNIRYGRATATDAEVEAAARAANAHDFISAFPEGYQTPVGERGVQLSGGQKQRVAIARAVLKDPRILVLDEATSALDAESEHLVQEALERLMQGRTTLIIAHRLSTVMRADRVLVIDGGRVVQAGSHAHLVEEEGLYRRLVERQFVAA